MNFFRHITLALAISTVSVTVFGQTNSTTQGATNTAPVQAQQIGTVSGKLTDTKGKPVSYATVTLMRADSSVVNGDLSKDDGSFSITPTGIGTFILKVSAIGLNPLIVGDIKVTADAPVKSLGKLKVTSNSNTLKEVNITGERPLMEMSVDKKVFNVEKNTTTAGGSASDVLQNVPSVSVDVDGTVSLRGKSDVTILIDGKPATLLGTDAASALQSLPAASIESVEVITNPSAKYDAQGLTGIINIITKKDKKLGINGNVTLGAGTADKYNGNLGLNVRKGKWNVFLNSSFRLNRNYNNTTTDLYDKAGDGSIHTNEHSHRHFDGFFNSIGATYDFDKNNSITFTQNVNKMDFGYKDSANNNTYANNNESGAYSTLGRRSLGDGGPLSFSSSADYKHKFKKKDEEISIDATFASTTISRNTDYYNYYYDETGSLINNSPSHEAAPGTGSNSSFNAWADYTDPLFTKNGKLGLGFKSQFYWFQSSSNPFITYADGTTAVDSPLLNNFKYNQQIHAAYANWNDQIGKFSYQVGLRFESATYSGSDYIINDSVYKNSFTNLFPSAFISYQLPHQQSIYLNYSRRTNRPSFWELLPYKDLSNPAVVSQGNPGLNPEFIDNIEFSYNKQDNKGNNIILSTYFQYNKNLIERVDTYIDSTKQTFREPYNLASGTTYGFEGTAHLQLLPIWDATVNFNLFQNDINVGNADASANLTNQSGFSWMGKVNTNIKLPANFSLQINGNYESPKVVAQGKLEEVYWVDVALRKNLWKNKATIVINCSDIFNTRKYTTLYNTPSYNETLYRDRETRVGNLTFTYRFGKSDFGSKAEGKGKRSKNTDNNTDSKDRENNLKQDGDNDQGGGGGTQGGPNGGTGAKGGPRS